MAQVLKLLAIAFVMLAVDLPNAQAMPIEGRVRGIEKPFHLKTVNGVSFKYDLDFKLGLLLGDPVVQLRFRWKADRRLTKVKVPVRRNGKWVDVEKSLYDVRRILLGKNFDFGALLLEGNRGDEFLGLDNGFTGSFS